MTYLLDTNVCIAAMRGNAKVQLAISPDNVPNLERPFKF